MWKDNWKTSNHFHNFNTLMIKHYSNSLSIHRWYCCVFFSHVISNISNLNLYSDNSNCFDKTYQNVVFLVHFLTNSKKIKIGLGHLGIRMDINNVRKTLNPPFQVEPTRWKCKFWGVKVKSCPLFCANVLDPSLLIWGL